MRTISESALIRRINRKLAKDCQKLHKTRPRWVNECGPYHIVDESRNQFLGGYFDLQALGRELGVLGQDEEVGK